MQLRAEMSITDNKLDGFMDMEFDHKMLQICIVIYRYLISQWCKILNFRLLSISSTKASWFMLTAITQSNFLFDSGYLYRFHIWLWGLMGSFRIDNRYYQEGNWMVCFLQKGRIRPQAMPCDSFIVRWCASSMLPLHAWIHVYEFD